MQFFDILMLDDDLVIPGHVDRVFMDGEGVMSTSE